MFKRLTLALVLVLFAGSVAVQAANPFLTRKRSVASKKIDQSSKEGVAKTLILAMLDKDMDTVWKLLDPELIKLADQNGISQKDFAEYMQKEININKLGEAMGMPAADAVKFMKAFINDDIDAIWAMLPQKEKKEAIEECGSAAAAKQMIKQFFPDMKKGLFEKFYEDVKIVQRNGKWYISDDNFLKKTAKSAAKKSGIKQSTKAESAETFAIAVANGNGDVIWQLLSPANKKAMIEESGSEAAVRKSLAEAFKPDAEAQKMLANPAQKKVFVNAVVEGINEKDAWVYSNGKWYIDFIKMND